MGETTGIAWTDHTFNPWQGCVRVSPGCENCYAESNDARWFPGDEHWGVGAARRFFGDKHWNDPRRWNHRAKLAGVRRRVFCASMADVFEDRPALDAQRARLWTLIDETPGLDWLLLTKRPENIERMRPKALPGANIWLGVTGENDKYARERADDLREIPAAVRFISYEPALAPVDWDAVLGPGGIDWIIIGGESGFGGKIREFQLEWAREALAACRRFGVAPFVKQLGRYPRGDGRLLQLRAKRAGDDFDEFPVDLRVREFPRPRVAA
jgi:protein gp37